MPTSDPARPEIVLITHPEAGAREFARTLVARRLAACVNLTPVTSVYRWDGAVQEDGEVLLVVKTTHGKRRVLEAVLVAEHPYDVPECIVVEPDHVEPKYLNWLVGETVSGEEA